MTSYSDPNYDPGGVNNPGKGQSPSNPLAPVFIQSLGVVEDLSVYSNIFAGGTINADVGFTLGKENFIGKEGFQFNPPGTFNNDIFLQKDLEILNNVFVGNTITVGKSIIMNGLPFKPKVIKADSGVHLVLAAY